MSEPKYSKAIAEYWDDMHARNDSDALTGASLRVHCDTLRVSVTPGSRVLCIGVGTGGWVFELAKLASVSVLDVSSEALRKVQSVAATYNTPGDIPASAFDLAMSLWVAPHVNDPELQEQMECVIRSLAPGGVFAVHYNEPLDNDAVCDNRCGCDDELERVRLAAMVRRRGHFARMVACAGGDEPDIVSAGDVPHCLIKMVVAHVRQKHHMSA